MTVGEETDQREWRLRERWSKTSDLLRGLDSEALLLTAPSDVRWLTGYSGSNGAALAVVGKPPLLATDGRYADQAAEECPNVSIVVTRDLIDQLLMRLREYSVSSLVVDPSSMTLAEFRAIAAHPAVFGIGVREEPAPVASLRQSKDPHELECLRRACQISCDALELLLPEIVVGVSELALARRLEWQMGELGADDRSFETIVATGPNGGQPHHQPGLRELAPGDLVTVDFGALVEGYHADCTRTFIVDAEPEEWQKEIYQVVRLAAEEGRSAAQPGVATKEVDAAARSVITEAGFGGNFVHGLGHGVGLDIHEAPMLGAATAGTLGDAVPVTVEPGIYLPGQGGVRIEDTCLVRDEGLEIMTDFPRDLIRVG